MATASVRKPRRKVAPPPSPPAGPAPDRALIAAEQYWEETRRPFPCLLFLAPLLIAHEIGVLWLSRGHDELLRNGADTWMRSWLYAVGVHQSFVLPLVVLALLLIWNFYGYFNWRVRIETLCGMLAESLIFAFVLVVAGQASELVCRQAGLPTAAISSSIPRPDLAASEHAASNPVPLSLERAVKSEGSASASPVSWTLPRLAVGTDEKENNAAGEPLAPGPSPEGEGNEFAYTEQAASPTERTAARTLTFIGAGIYEEVLFRLLLLPACYMWFRMLRASQRASMTLSILTTSLMFALAHYIGPAGDSLVLYTFCFRVAAGAYFAGLFVTRGFGITVGAHAIYDLIVGVLWAG